MGDWIQLGGGGNGEPWYKEYPDDVVVFRADDDPNGDCAIGFQYSELDGLPRYVKLIAERDELQELLASIEWIEMGDDEWWDGCPKCYGERVEGHHRNCELAWALGVITK